MRLRTVTEAEHQRAYMQWAKLYGILPYIIVSVSAAARAKKTASNLKSQGWQAGIPDWLVAIPNKYVNGLFIELKRPKMYKPVVSSAQRSFIDRLREMRYQAEVAYGWEEARAITINYMNHRE